MNAFGIVLIVLAVIGGISLITTFVFKNSACKSKEAFVDIFSYLALTNLALLLIFSLICKGSGVI